MTHDDFKVKTLGPGEFKSKLSPSSPTNELSFGFVKNDDRVLFNTTLDSYKQGSEVGETPLSFEMAGPHEYLYFNPADTKVAIVTCGGLCPGVNNVIQSVVNQLYYRYHVNKIVGIRYGYEGFIAKYDHKVVDITPQSIDKIHFFGGTVLGTSRGEQDVVQIVDTLSALNANILFCIGGDGTLRGAHVCRQN